MYICFLRYNFCQIILQCFVYNIIHFLICLGWRTAKRHFAGTNIIISLPSLPSNYKLKEFITIYFQNAKLDHPFVINGFIQFYGVHKGRRDSKFKQSIIWVLYSFEFHFVSVGSYFSIHLFFYFCWKSITLVVWKILTGLPDGPTDQQRGHTYIVSSV